MTLKELQAAADAANNAWVRIIMYRHMTPAEKEVCAEYQAMIKANDALNKAKREAKYK